MEGDKIGTLKTGGAWCRSARTAINKKVKQAPAYLVLSGVEMVHVHKRDRIAILVVIQ